jgi:hypothetical protein
MYKKILIMLYESLLEDLILYIHGQAQKFATKVYQTEKLCKVAVIYTDLRSIGS